MLWEAVAAVPRHATVTAAGLSLDPPLSERAMRYRLQVAAEKGISLNSPPPPDGFKTQGVSTLYDGAGNVKSRWVKDRLEGDKAQAALEETVKAFMEPLRGLAKPSKAPKTQDADTLTELILADLHVGMYAYGMEAGDDYDSSIASDLAKSAIDRLVASSPPSGECVINNLGDLYHMDSSRNETAAGTPVDVDTRYRRVLNTGVQIMRYAIVSALNHFGKIRVRNTPGNHDTHSSAVLDFALKAYFENDPRVEVEDSPKPFWAYRFHSNLVGIAHGHAPKASKLPGLLACDYPQWWAECEHKYCRHGHLHHASGTEELGVKVEGYRTLAPKDFWHASQGYRSSREAVAIVLHKDFGEIERHTAGIARIRHESPRNT